MMREQERMMVIDTDGGVDDALAVLLALLNNQPRPFDEWKVLAITTVHGNVDVDQATDNMLRILNFAKRTEVPVFKGCHSSILVQRHQRRSADLFGRDGMSDCSHRYPLPDDCTPTSETAVNALIRLVKERPKQITLVCLGPLSNVALAHRLDRTFAENLKELFIMGGNDVTARVAGSAEFNFLSDSEAADIALHEFACPKTIVTYEACIAHQQPWEWYDRWTSKGTERSQFVGQVTAKVIANRKPMGHQFMCCDLLAMTALVNPSVVLESSFIGHARVELLDDVNHVRGLLMAITDRSKERPEASNVVCLHAVYDTDAVRRTWDEMTD